MRLSRPLALLPILLVLVVAALWGSYRWSERYFLSEISDRGRDSLTLYAENMRGWLGRYQALPRIYAQNPNVAALLSEPSDQTLKNTVNAFLTEWNLATGAADTYLLDHTGTAIAASNWADDITFVGKNYDYRPYYSQAMRGQLGRFFALGTASGKRGYYFSYPVRSGAEAIGVMVVKVGVEEIEAKLEAGTDELFVTGPEGVILMAGHPDWRLKTLAPLDAAAQERIRQNKQFDLESLAPIGAFGTALQGADGQRVSADPNRLDQGPQEFLHLSLPMTIEGWRLHILVNTRFARTQAVTIVLLVGSVILGLALIATVIWQRRRRLVELLGERERARATLERRVKERTADLRTSNLQLGEEVNERKAAEEELRRTQDELIQAGKLAALGQMSAALSHEFNQPLAAIRTYADNAGVFLDRGRDSEARDNIGHISALTERMAGLSKHLSSFARKPQGSVRAVSMNRALDETLALLKGRFDGAGLTPRVVIAGAGEIRVQGGHIRLQQVIMNLVTNALDATKGRPDPQLILTLEEDAETVRLIVEDNGAGLPAEQQERIFDPFFTTKEVGEGLGLGLSITYNIVKDFGGSIAAENRAEGGARFVLTLRAASPIEDTEADDGEDDDGEDDHSEDGDAKDAAE